MDRMSIYYNEYSSCYSAHVAFIDHVLKWSSNSSDATLYRGGGSSSELGGGDTYVRALCNLPGTQ